MENNENITEENMNKNGYITETPKKQSNSLEDLTFGRSPRSSKKDREISNNDDNNKITESGYYMRGKALQKSQEKNPQQRSQNLNSNNMRGNMNAVNALSREQLKRKREINKSREKNEMNVLTRFELAPKSAANLVKENEEYEMDDKKKKKNWKNWSSQEKELFYEAIANGGNYSSLQKLFKNMNDVN